MKSLVTEQKQRETKKITLVSLLGWSGGEMVLGKLSVQGPHTNLDHRRVKAYCPCSVCGWGLFVHFFSHHFSLLSPSLWEMA